MTLQNLLNNLSPINTKEKVDTLIQEMKKCGLKMTKNAEVVIRCAIQKANIQKYIIETYSRLFVEKDKPKKKVQNNVNPPLMVTLPTKKDKKKWEKEKKVTKADINRLKSQLKKEKVSKKIEEQSEENFAIPSILRIFGSKSKSKNKMSYKEREKIAPHKKEYSTATKTSLYSIGIPMK